MNARVAATRAHVAQTRRVVVTRASAKTPAKQESRREFARNAAFLAAAAVLSVAKAPTATAAEEIPEKLKKKICANNSTAKVCFGK